MVIQYPTHMHGLCCLFLLILIQVSSCTIKVIGLIGHNVTLPCTYDAQTYGVLSFCWGQGKVPTSKCSNTILSSDGGVVSYRHSPRYQLLGRVTEGELSLTILNAQKSDAGMYGCRIEIPGWFNDHKANSHLVIEEAPVDQPVPEDYTLSAAVTEEIRTTSALESLGVILEKIQSEKNEETSKPFLGVGNIGRMATVFCLTVIVILVCVIRRTILSRRTLQYPDTLATENIYETITTTK